LTLSIRIALMLGWQDVKQAYRRSAIGAFWITAGLAVQIATMGFVFTMLFKTNPADYLPYLTASTILWGLISSIISDGCFSFINAEAIIKQLKIPIFTHVLRVAWKSIITMGHNLVILPIVFLVFGRGIGIEVLLSIPGLLIVIANLIWIAMLLSMVSSRFRDMPPIIGSLMTVVFYLTPVIWQPALIGNNQLAHFLLGLNPFYHLLQVIRAPILGELPTLENWTLSLLCAVVGWSLTLIIFRKFQNKIAYWV
jgi:ABC-type polysaccharide/polyol phosphate export permease